MINETLIEEIIVLYQKHDWKLRRILLTDAAYKKLSGSLKEKFEGIEITSSEIDAAWFSRASGEEREAWELRRLSETPYALFEMFEADDDPEVCEETRNEMEARLRV